uniref:Uncharacterized protein n=1 Tax=Cajanus cajan TaxID=3821 RepID=A0A151QNZ3_CAJCA|nr:hypothetical protein KK1_047443 [Cajanus cajan]
MLPKSTLDKLTIKGAQIRPSNIIVQAFDEFRREVMGEISLLIQVEPTIFIIEFQVMDIAPTYSCLLGRPWIHQEKGVPLTLHQKIKFIFDDKLIVVQAKKDMIINKSLTILYVDLTEEALETTFQELEIAHVEKVSSKRNLVSQILFKNDY